MEVYLLFHLPFDAVFEQEAIQSGVNEFEATHIYSCPQASVNLSTLEDNRKSRAPESRRPIRRARSVSVPTTIIIHTSAPPLGLYGRPSSPGHKPRPRIRSIETPTP